MEGGGCNLRSLTLANPKVVQGLKYWYPCLQHTYNHKNISVNTSWGVCSVLGLWNWGGMGAKFGLNFCNSYCTFLFSPE